MKHWLAAGAFGAALNILDAVLTMQALERHSAVEANPLLALLLSASVPMFYVAKCAVAGLFLLLGYFASELSLARVALSVGCAAYIAVALYHLIGPFC